MRFGGALVGVGAALVTSALGGSFMLWWGIVLVSLGIVVATLEDM